MAAYTPEQLAMLEAQVAYFASDEHVRAEVGVWRDAEQERFAELKRMCEEADHFLAQLSPDELERALAPDPLPADSVALLAALRQAR